MPTLPITANLAAWYRFNQGITSSSNLVSRWNDASGNGRHLLQATGTNQPLLMPDGSILFDGVDNFMAATISTIPIPFTVYLLFRQVTWTASDIIFDNTSRLLLAQAAATSPNIALLSDDAANDGLALNTYGVVAFQYHTTGDLLQVNNTTPTTGATLGVETGTSLTLSAAVGGGGQWSHAQFKEILLYSAAHDFATRRQVVAYLLELLNPIPYVNAVLSSRIRRR